MGESEQIERVTSDKPKNTGRQEWGKKLGKMQAEIKAKKFVEEQPHNFLTWQTVGFVGSLGLGLLGLLYYWKNSYSVQRPEIQVTNNVVESSKNKEVRFSGF